MARKATGQLIWRASGWYGRFTATVDGERVRVCRALGTENKAVAKRKLAKLIAEGVQCDPKAAETFAEAAERVYQARIAEAGSDPEAARGPRHELSSLRRYAREPIGHMAVGAVRPTDINAVLDAGKDAGLSRQSVQHLRQRMSNVFAALQREGAIDANPVRDAAMPRFPEAVRRERAVLTDAELAVYLAWTHPKARFQDAARERQTMACVARMFGGLRAGDLHVLRWEALDTEGGRFAHGFAPRQKTRRPQLLAIPAALRPFLRDWWERAGRPSEGLVFPVRRPGRRGDRVGQARGHSSHAEAFRRDLRAAFRGAPEGVQVPKGPPMVEGKYGPDSAGDKRWRELFSDAEPYTRPVDFHSWRRAYVQALADAEVNAQQAAALAGHADLGAHMRYLANAGKMREIPEAALPDLRVLEAHAADAEGDAAQRALAKGRQAKGRVRISKRRRVDADESGENPTGARPVARFPSCRSWVRIPLPAPESQGFSEQGDSEKAPALPNGSPDAVESALADAITKAAAAGQWDAVQALTGELQARRQARAGAVDLASERAKRGRT